ncbi:MAG: heme lyase CcmF/NrfE family subunit [Legionellales bacterium]|nr:heme lyase CcmF/NrfE family subunit [Legionellales bacterium]
MVVEIGHFLLAIVFPLTLLQVFASFYAATSFNKTFFIFSNRCIRLNTVAVLVSFLFLLYGFIVDEFSVLYIAVNSNSKLPLLYKACAVWSGHEGSLLLWLVILSLFQFLISRTRRINCLSMHSYVLGVLALVQLSFVIFLLFFANPFERSLPVFPNDGRGVNPILQVPLLVFHAPVVYLAYSALAVSYAFAIAALLRGKFDKEWFVWLRPWVYWAWSFLTIALVMGSWLSYHTLGWGGWWSWDPVENVMLMPWLITTAMFHSTVYVEKKNSYESVFISLAIAAFSLCLLSTFLMRSGILRSVHNFAQDGYNATFLLLLVFINVIFAMVVYMFRINTIATRVRCNLFSREATMIIGAIILVVMAATVLMGTLYPLLSDLVFSKKIFVGAAYFNEAFYLMGVLLLFAMATAPYCRWGGECISSGWRLFGIAVFALVFCVSTTFNLLSYKFDFFLFALLFFGLSLVPLVVRKFTNCWPYIKSNLAMLLSHVGVFMVVFAMISSTVFVTGHEIKAAVGELVEVGPYKVRINSVYNKHGTNYKSLVANTVIIDDAGSVYYLSPEFRTFNFSKRSISKPVISSSFLRDIHLSLTKRHHDKSISYMFYIKPFVQVLWLGWFFVILGSLIAIFKYWGLALFFDERQKDL